MVNHFRTPPYVAEKVAKVDIGVPQRKGEKGALDQIGPMPYERGGDGPVEMITKLNAALDVDTKDSDTLCGTKGNASKERKRDEETSREQCIVTLTDTGIHLVTG
ncbi:hypothetical protein EVAR_92719_1 [Eumeta japonica]|uniref:Uncharacterized protein n=1 Tax=Eumeta variegata TaxID=151549 RepID=A0A4C1SZX5_EUMVA|nr:hypothetical protein EVAR_92719_1 [Eumeta japonica]